MKYISLVLIIISMKTNELSLQLNITGLFPVSCFLGHSWWSRLTWDSSLQEALVYFVRVLFVSLPSVYSLEHIWSHRNCCSVCLWLDEFRGPYDGQLGLHHVLSGSGASDQVSWAEHETNSACGVWVCCARNGIESQFLFEKTCNLVDLCYVK